MCAAPLVAGSLLAALAVVACTPPIRCRRSATSACADLSGADEADCRARESARRAGVTPRAGDAPVAGQEDLRR